MATTITATDAYKNFSDVLHRAHFEGEVVIEKNGKPYALLSAIRTPRTGAEISRSLKRSPLPVFSAKEAEDFAADIESARKLTNQPFANKW